MPTVRFAKRDDFGWCMAQDHGVSADMLLRKIAAGEVIVAEEGKQQIGYLRLEYLWSSIPYIALIWIPENWRKQGIGRAMLAFLEEFARGQGHKMLMSSSQVNEPEPQAWHRHMGFEECGILNGINNGGIGEVFFRKAL
ncbi:MAG TPA: GNAT family N-acetyltransferase [Aggregatilineaceae bacterium]|nr:GNAT family N-acetyltransferase [Aggregatilineaceae bacterium]